MNKVLFISPNKTSALSPGGDPVQKLRSNMSIPAATILGKLSESGYRCYFVDSAADGLDNILQLNDKLISYGLSDDQICDKVAQIAPHYILITSMFTFEQVVVDALINKIKSEFPLIQIIIGGIHASTKPEWHLETSSPDFIVIGDGEDSIIKLLNELKMKAQNVNKIPGLVYRNKHGNIVRTGRRSRINNLDQPWCFEEVLLNDGKQRYLEKNTRKSPIYVSDILGEDVSSAAIYGSRGCPMCCNYCTATDRNGGTVRHMGGERMVSDVIQLHKEYGVSVFYNQADTFGSHSEDILFLKKLSEYRLSLDKDTLIINNPNAFFLKLFFKIEFGKIVIDDYFISLLSKAGFNVITLAVESFTQRFSKKIDWSRITFDLIRELCIAIHNQDIKVDFYMMYGFPGQIKEEFDLDVTTIHRLAAHVDWVSWHFFTVLPGSTIFNNLIESGKLNENEYRLAVNKGYSFFRPEGPYNLSNISSNYLVERIGDFGQAWV